MTAACFPNLPQRMVKTVICGEHPVVIQALEQRGIEVITVKASQQLPVPVADHADMLCCHVGPGSLLTADVALADILRRRSIDCTVIKKSPGGRYPEDVPLNCLVTGRFAVGRADALAPELTALLARSCTELIGVKQGYARCSVAVVDERSVITADKCIAAAMTAVGFDVLLISPAGIILEGYDTGFIGGCCGKLSADRLLFCGDVRSHPDGERILAFLAAREVTAESTHSGKLVDFGGFITLTE